MAVIKLYGDLAEKFRDEYRLDVNSPHEAVRALSVMVPNFRNTFKEGGYYIYVENNEHINIDEHNFHLRTPGTIHILPEVIGAKKSGLGKVLLGIAMIAFVPLTGGLSLANFIGAAGAGQAALLGTHAAATTAIGLANTAITNLGWALAIGGAVSMLSPKVKNSSSAEKEASGVFSGGATATLANGVAVPLIYGEYLAVGQPISFEISDATTNYVTSSTDYNTSVGGWNFTDITVRA